MALSRARRNFRVILLILLGLSFAFAGTMAYYRASFKRTAEIAPYIFAFDVAQFQARAFFASDDGKHKIALELLKNSFFSIQYGKPGREMIDTLAAKLHAPSMTVKANYLIRTPHPTAQNEAITLYRLAAAQDYQPAEDMLAELGLEESTVSP